jgi:hypothetical protein
MNRVDFLLAWMLDETRETRQKTGYAKTKNNAYDDANMRESFRRWHASR